MSEIRGWHLCFPCGIREEEQGKHLQLSLKCFPPCSPFSVQDFQGWKWFLLFRNLRVSVDLSAVPSMHVSGNWACQGWWEGTGFSVLAPERKFGAWASF